MPHFTHTGSLPNHLLIATKPISAVQQDRLFTPAAVDFLVKLHRVFNARRLELLKQRVLRQQRINAGELPDFLPHTKHIREEQWQVDPVPAILHDRRVEITGPVDRKMIINALNSGAKVFMADFEDSNSPTFQNNLEGQLNLQDAVRKTIAYVNPEGKRYALHSEVAVLFVRPRGLHLQERHLLVDDEQMSGSLLDFGLFFFHNAHLLASRKQGPFFYLPKIENHLEARFWNEVFVFAQQELSLPVGTIKATVLIETILACFEMHEILFELKHHSAGLNCGRWDYIFSFIKKMHRHTFEPLPDRSLITMESPFLKSYALLLIQTCHQRGTHAMGGMAAQIPIKDNEEANRQALEKVRNDKLREVRQGHDGTWVAHPGLIPLVLDVFNQHMPQPNQVNHQLKGIQISRKDLLEVPGGPITLKGLRHNIDVSIQYIAAWLTGQGCVPIYNLMEDAATAEISRTQVWQWIHHPLAKLEEGQKITLELCRSLIPGIVEDIQKMKHHDPVYLSRLTDAVALFDKLMSSDKLHEFLTTEAYGIL